MKNKIVKIVVALVFIVVIFISLIVWGVKSSIGFIKSSVIPMLPNANIASVSDKQVNSPNVANGFKTLNSYNIILASITISEDVKSKQKIILINPGIFFNITKQDIESNNIESQLKGIASIGPVQIINFDKLEIVKKGYFKVGQQNIPYVKGNFGILSGGKVSSEGIIGVIDTVNSKNNILISTANSGKFSLKIVEDFLNK